MEEEFLGHGAIKSSAEEIAKNSVNLKIGVSAPFDWVAGFDFEKQYGIKIKIKNQMNSESCGGQAGSYGVAGAEIVCGSNPKEYLEYSAKSIYSQIFLSPDGGVEEATLMNFLANQGANLESLVPSTSSNGIVTEEFMEDKTWMTPELQKEAQVAKVYLPAVVPNDMESWACAIRDHGFLIVAVQGENDGTWNTNEPQPPTNPTWGHFLFFAKAGTDTIGKYIATPNSWGDCRAHDTLHLDGWQKFRQNWFDNGAQNIWTAYTFIEKQPMTDEQVLIKDAQSSAIAVLCKSEAAFRVMMDALISKFPGQYLPYPLKADGSVDWSSITIDKLFKFQ